MSNTIYIVSEIGWDYDDNYYYRTGNGATHPVEAYLIEELAQEAAMQKEVDFISKLLVAGDSVVRLYKQDEELEYHDHKEWIEECERKYNISFDEYLNPYVIGEGGKKSKNFRGLSPSDTPRQFYVDYINHFEFEFYEVVKVELLA